ncbi:hypothetical protein R3X28_19200, partial [Maribacter sp. TH_r10]|uniref:hypothetical protein n=1 Tax=Maribacter sp. TH_r10 TaxID=3082086 RepID=UPI002955061D
GTNDTLTLLDSEGNVVEVPLADIAALTDTNTTNDTLSLTDSDSDGTNDTLTLLDSEGNVVEIPLADIAALVDTDTQYTAGTGLVLTGTVFSADASLATDAEVAASELTTSVTAGTGVSVNSSTTGNNTEYTVAVDETAIADGTLSSTNATIAITGGDDSIFKDVSVDVADNAITNAKMADDAIDTAELVNDAVTLDKIADGTLLGQVMQWDGSDWTLVDLGSVTVTENDGVIGNEVV